MNKITFRYWWLLFIIPGISFAQTPDESDLIKVDSKSNAKCVEYYKKDGDLYCTTKPTMPATDNSQIDRLEKFNIKFDDREWVPAWHQESPEINTIEYVPKGEDINNWHELITSQSIPQANMTPKEYADSVAENLRSSGFDPIVKFIEDTPTRVIWEFRIEKPENQKQDELQVITKEGDTLYLIHYVIKEPDMGDEQRTLWIDNLKNSSLKE